MGARFCTKCGAPLAEGAAFCTACGAAAALVDSTEPLPVQPAPGQPVAPAPGPDPSVSPKPRAVPVWVWAVLGVIALALVGVGVWALVARPWADEEPLAEKPGVSQEATQPVTTEEPAEEEIEEPVVSPYEGMPISTPQKGDAVRASLMDAARALTGSSAQFLVWQLYVQGDSAIGDIQEFTGEGKTPGRRWLVTWERSGGSWQGKYYDPFLDVVRGDVKPASPFLSDGIITKMSFVVPVSRPPRAADAADAAQSSDIEPFTIWVPTRMPEGYTFAEESVDPNMYSARWRSGSKEVGMVVGWGDGELGGAEDLVIAPANWGSMAGSYGSSDDLDYDAVWGDTRVSTELWGDVPEFMLRAVAMSMERVEP